MQKRHKAYVAFGSNQGRRQKNIERALRLLREHKEIRLARVSSLYRTEPVGGPRQPSFLNGVAKIETPLSPQAVLRVLKAVEKALGRTQTVRWGPRLIDLDLLTFGKRIVKSGFLTIPHARYHKRRFVLIPFSEIAPGFTHPVLGVKNRVLAAQLTVKGQRVTMVATWKRDRFYPSKPKRDKKNPSSP